LGNAKLWLCIQCADETIQPQILRDRRGGWICRSWCSRCDVMNYHNKRADWIPAQTAWRAIGVNNTVQHMRGHWEQIQHWKNEKPEFPARASGEEVADHDVSERTLNFSLTPDEPDLQTNPNQDATKEGAPMNIHDDFPSKYLKADDLKGKRLPVVIEGFDHEKIGKEKEEQPILYFKKQKKGLVLNKTNSLAIEEVLGTAETDEWINKKIVLYPTRVDFQGKRVPAIRVETPEDGKADNKSPSDDDVPF
jgi:hypothetical protein